MVFLIRSLKAFGAWFNYRQHLCWHKTSYEQRWQYGMLVRRRKDNLFVHFGRRDDLNVNYHKHSGGCLSYQSFLEDSIANYTCFLKNCSNIESNYNISKFGFLPFEGKKRAQCFSNFLRQLIFSFSDGSHIESVQPPRKPHDVNGNRKWQLSIPPI